MPGTPDDAIKMVTSVGFVFKRQNGSHRIYYNPETKQSISIPYHKKDMKPGIWNDILKRAGVK